MDKLEEALRLIESRQLASARALLEELLKEQPMNTDVLYNLGMVYTELGHPAEAIQALSKCIEYGHDTSNVHVAIGYAHSKLGNYSMAEEFFINALEIDKNNPYALRNLGSVYGRKGDFVRGLDCLRRAFALNPNDINTAYGLGLMYFNLGDLSNADRYLHDTISIDTSSPLAQMAKDLLREIAVVNLKSKGFRVDAMFYCIHALQLFKKKSLEEIRKISFEIGVKGQQGLDINNPAKKYTLGSLEGEFTGLQLVSYMYVGFKKIAPDMDVGIDLSQEYDMAVKFVNLKGSHGHILN